jgi:murein DD-endopeptidase MepM/ murein hydrolase activator NlpD
MNEKKSFSQKLEAFFAGKGFYIVLFLCVAVIGVSAWVMLTGTGTDVDAPEGYEDIAGGRMPKETNGAVIPATPRVVTPVPSEPAVTSSGAEASDDAEQADASAEDAEDASDASSGDSAEVWNEETENAADFFVWPVQGNVENPYSVTTLRYDRTMMDWRTHEGIDIAADLGTQVMAAASGTVKSVKRDDLYGVTVEILHNNGLVSVYSNLAELPTVQEGDGIMVGEVIGAVGETAICEAGEVCHLHFAMIQDGRTVDPLEYLPDR